MNKYCCDELKQLIEDPKSPLEYKAKIRAYRLSSKPEYFRKKNEAYIAYYIKYCPMCAAKLPSNLVEEWFSLVKKRFGITGLLDERAKDLPQEFKTDEWWKKRGL